MNVLERSIPFGLTIAEIAEAWFGAHDTSVGALIRAPAGAPVEWEIVPRERWRSVRPLGDRCLKFEIVQHDGDSGLLAGIGLVVLSVVAPYLAPAFAASAFGSAVLSATLSAGLSLTAQALFAPSSSGAASSPADQQTGQLANVDSDNNLLAKGGRLPWVFGTRRISPPDVCESHRFLEKGREVITRVLACDGEHRLEELQVGKVLIGSIPDAEWQIVDGHESSGQQDLVNVVTRTFAIGQKLSKFSIKSDSDKLSDQSDPSNSEPVPVIIPVTYHKSMSEISIRFALSPFAQLSDPAAKTRQPVRISFWKKSDPSTIYRLPEYHIQGRKTAESLKEVRFRWDKDFGLSSASRDFSYDFWRRVPASVTRTLSDGSSGYQWTADDYFGTGNKDVVNIHETGDGLNVTLDESIHAKSEYEFSVIAGLPIADADFNSTNYQLNGVVESLFRAFDDNANWKIPTGQDGISAGVSVQFATLIVNERPIQAPGFAHIALKLREVDAKNITVKASGFVDDYNDGYFVIDEDMRSLTIGGTDFSDNTVTGLRIDPSSILADGNFEFDFVELVDRFGRVGWRDDFSNGVGNWTANNGTLSVSGEKMLLTVTTDDGGIKNETDISVDGSIYYRLRIGIKKIDSGQCGGWQGRIFFSTAGHGFSGSYYKDFTEPTWSVTGWIYHTTTANPASHMHQLVSDWLAFSRVNADRLNSQAFIDWRAECAAQGYRVSYPAAGQSMIEVMEHMTTAGFATRRLDSGYSVDWHRDRTAELPTMVFSPRDSQISFERTFSETPKALKARFQDRSSDWQSRELLINNAYGTAAFGESEALDYPSIDDETLIRRRATFDLLQLKHRQIRWKVNTGPAGFNRRKGDLVGLVTDLVSDYAHGFRVAEVISTTQIRVDREVPEGGGEFLEESVDISAEADIFEVGASSSAMIVMPSGVEEYVVANVVEDVLTLATPLTATAIEGTRLTVAPRETLFRRCIVLSVERQPEQRALLTLVDEAPEIESELQRLF